MRLQWSASGSNPVRKTSKISSSAAEHSEVGDRRTLDSLETGTKLKDPCGPLSCLKTSPVVRDVVARREAKSAEKSCGAQGAALSSRCTRS